MGLQALSNDEVGGGAVSEDELTPGQKMLQKMRADVDLRRFVKAAADDILQLEQQRKAINEQMAAVRESVVEKGINRHAFKAAVARYKLEEADRLEREISYRACLIALQIEDQVELFTDNDDSLH